MIRLLALSGVAVGALLWTIAAKNVEERHLRQTIHDQAACQASVAGEKDAGPPAKMCPPLVALVADRAARAARCDDALGKLDAFAIDAACSTPVKTAVAERDAARRERDTNKTALDVLRAGQAAAIARAEARGKAQAERTNRAQDLLDAAPRTDAGLGHCDAVCLRQLAGQD